jgi:hypothetical protein
LVNVTTYSQHNKNKKETKNFIIFIITSKEHFEYWCNKLPRICVSFQFFHYVGEIHIQG